jgi:hypothetical protein
MTARRFSEATQKDYVRNVRNFTAFLGRSPDTATSDDLRRFQLHMAQQQVSPWSVNAAIAALPFFFSVTLERPDLVRPLRIVNEPCKAPVVLSQEEVARLLEPAPGLKYKAALSVVDRVSAGHCGVVERVDDLIARSPGEARHGLSLARQVVRNVSYAGDEGAVVGHIEPDGGREAVVVSLTLADAAQPPSPRSAKPES